MEYKIDTRQFFIPFLVHSVKSGSLKVPKTRLPLPPFCAISLYQWRHKQGPKVAKTYHTSRGYLLLWLLLFFGKERNNTLAVPWGVQIHWGRGGGGGGGARGVRDCFSYKYWYPRPTPTPQKTNKQTHTHTHKKKSTTNKQNAPPKNNNKNNNNQQQKNHTTTQTTTTKTKRSSQIEILTKFAMFIGQVNLRFGFPFNLERETTRLVWRSCESIPLSYI